MTQLLFEFVVSQIANSNSIVSWTVVEVLYNEKVNKLKKKNHKKADKHFFH